MHSYSEPNKMVEQFLEYLCYELLYIACIFEVVSMKQVSTASCTNFDSYFFWVYKYKSVIVS